MKHKLPIAALVMLALSASTARACDTLEACLGQLSALAASPTRSYDREDSLAATLASFGAPAVRPLLSRLDAANPTEKRVASRALATIDTSEPEDTSVLIAAMQNHHGVVIGILAHSGSQKAADAIAAYLREHPRQIIQVPESQRHLGDEGIALIAEGFACAEDCDYSARRAFDLISELRGSALPALPRLLEIAASSLFDREARRWAIEAIGRIGPAARTADDTLLLIGSQTPELSKTVHRVLTFIASPRAVPGLLQGLDAYPLETLTSIENLGSGGISAGSRIVHLLEHENWQVRIRATRALGSIEYREASPSLARLLTNIEDWQLVLEAILALASLGEREFIDNIDAVADTHWYPSLRLIADEAVAHLRDGTPISVYDSKSPYLVIREIKSCEKVQENVAVAENRILRTPDDQGTLRQLTYAASESFYFPFQGAQVSPDGYFMTRRQRATERVRAVRDTPQIAIKISNGWIAGANRGEWGGELVHIPTTGLPTILWGDNIYDIHVIDETIIAVAAAHFLTGRGALLLKVQRHRGGNWQAEPWLRISGVPYDSVMLENNQLLMHTRYGGSVVVNHLGNIRMANCLTDTES